MLELKSNPVSELNNKVLVTTLFMAQPWNWQYFNLLFCCITGVLMDCGRTKQLTLLGRNLIFFKFVRYFQFEIGSPLSKKFGNFNHVNVVYHRLCNVSLECKCSITSEIFSRFNDHWTASISCALLYCLNKIS